MKLEDQVCSLELAKRLKELGVKQESQFIWSADEIITFMVMGPAKTTRDGEFAAFTVAELGEMLPPTLGSPLDIEQYVYDGPRRYEVVAKTYLPEGDGEIVERTRFMSRLCENEADARAKMLIHLIENKLVAPKETTPND